MNITSYLQNKHLTIALTGELDHHSAKEVMKTVSKKIDLYLPVECVLNFRDVTFMDSSGIAIVIHAVRKMRQLQGNVILCEVPDFAKKVLLASGVDRIAEMEERRVPVYENQK